MAQHAARTVIRERTFVLGVLGLKEQRRDNTNNKRKLHHTKCVNKEKSRRVQCRVFSATKKHDECSVAFFSGTKKQDEYRPRVRPTTKNVTSKTRPVKVDYPNI